MGRRSGLMGVLSNEFVVFVGLADSAQWELLWGLSWPIPLALMLPLGEFLLVWWSSWIRDLHSAEPCKIKNIFFAHLLSAAVELIPLRPVARHHLAVAAEPWATVRSSQFCQSVKERNQRKELELEVFRPP